MKKGFTLVERHSNTSSNSVNNNTSSNENDR